MTELGGGVELLERAPNVVFCPHPLLPDVGRRLIFEAPRGGERLDAYLQRVLGRLPEPCVVTVGDTAIPRQWWPRVTVKPLAVVRVAAAVDGGGNSDVGRIVLTIVVIAVAVYTGGLAAGALGFAEGSVGASIVGGVVSAAVMQVGMMAVNALMPLPTADLSRASGETNSPTYSLAGASNRARRYEPLPLVIGTHRLFPDAACASYTLFEGDDQFLYAAYNFGFGDLQIGDLRIGNTPLGDYQDVTTVLVAGFMPGMVHGNVDTVDGGALTQAAGPIQKTTSLETTRIDVDLQFVLFHAGNAGLEWATATVTVEYRAVGSPTWLGMLPGGDAQFVCWSTSRTTVRRTISRAVAAGQYEVRIAKTTPDPTDERTTCSMAVPAIRSFQPVQGNFDGQTILGLKIRASGQLNGVVSQLSGLVSHRLGGVATGNPALWFKAFALGASSGAGRRLWGAGLTAGQLDLAALDAWAAWCDARELSCNLVIDQAVSVATVLDRIARCGRGSKTWATGRLGAVWDAGGLPVTAMFSPVNIRRGSFSIAYPSEALADELEVSYVNPDNGWQRDSVRVPPNATDVRRTASVELLGCTSTALAGREANLLFAQNLYRFRTISWETDVEGFTCRKGDVVTLSHDLTNWGQAGRFVGVASPTRVVLDRAIALPPGGCWMAVCRPAGDISYHRVQVGAAQTESDDVTLLDPLPTTPAADDSPAMDWRYTAGPQATPGWRVKITEIVPLPGMEGVRIFAQDDPAEYYAAEDGGFAHVAVPAATGMPVLSGLQVAEALIQAGAGYAVQLHLAWSAAGEVAATRVRFKVDAGAWQEGGFATGARHTVLIPDAGTVTLEVAAFNGMGQSSPDSRLSATHAIVGQDVPPPTPAGFGVTATADGTRVFAWSVAAVPPDVTYLEIRYAAASATAWAAMATVGRLPYGSGRAESNAPPVGTWTFEARMLDGSGNYSAAGARVTVALVAPPASVTGVQLVNQAGMSIEGSTARKSAATAAYDASFYSKDGFAGGAYVSWSPAAANTTFIVGLNADPAANTGYTGIDYGMLCYGDGNLYAYESGAQAAALGAYGAGDILAVTYDGTAVRYWKNGAALRTVAASIAASLFADSSFYSPGAEARNIQFGPLSSNAWASVGGSGKPLDNAGKVVDLGVGTGAGQRQADDPPAYYPVGLTQQFKASASVGLPVGEWGILRTERGYADDSGGSLIQTWKSTAGEWKRTGTLAGGWGAWSRRVDRMIDPTNVTQFVASEAIDTTQLAQHAATEVYRATGVLTALTPGSWTSVALVNIALAAQTSVELHFTGMLGNASGSADVVFMPQYVLNGDVNNPVNLLGSAFTLSFADGASSTRVISFSFADLFTLPAGTLTVKANVLTGIAGCWVNMPTLRIAAVKK